MEKKVLKGALLVGLGASSYGALATVVKLATAIVCHRCFLRATCHIPALGLAPSSLL